jgi:hypothetical protein
MMSKYLLPRAYPQEGNHPVAAAWCGRPSVTGSLTSKESLRDSYWLLPHFMPQDYSELADSNRLVQWVDTGLTDLRVYGSYLGRMLVYYAFLLVIFKVFASDLMKIQGSYREAMAYLRAGRPGNWGLILGRSKRFLFSPQRHTGSGVHLSCGYRRFFPRG